MTAPWHDLPTESANPASHDLDLRSTQEVVALLLDEDRRALEATRARAGEIATGAEWLAETLVGGGDVVFVGAGTSGRLGALEAAECPPTFGTDPERIRAVLAGGPEAIFRAREGAEDVAADGAAAVAGLAPRDLVVGLSASGVTPFVLGALGAARGRGLRTVLVTCGGVGEGSADLVIDLATGPEVLTGSTRLKAGSATKAALNALTTAAMVRLGKVYGNLMIDVRQGSAKLVDRAGRIVSAAAGVSLERARELLAAAGGEAKTALVMARGEVDAQEARRRLSQAAGHVRRALASLDAKVD
jgi:N-acetylmuramic acid 6-phosphate etherase